MNMDMVSDRRKHPLEALIGYEEPSQYSNCLFQSLPGVLEDIEVPDKPGDGVGQEETSFRSFHQDWILGTKLRLYLSSKSRAGVLEDIEVPDEPADGVRQVGAFFGSFSEIFFKIGHQEPSQDSICPLKFLPGV